MASSPQFTTPGLEVVNPVPKQELHQSYGVPPPSPGQGLLGSPRNGGYPTDPYPVETMNSRSKQGTFCGMRGTTLVLTIALITVILAAGIGGGIAGTMAVDNAKSANIKTVTSTTTLTPTGCSISAAASSATATPTTGITVPTTGFLALNCPSLSASNEIITLGTLSSTFGITCGQDFTPVNGVSSDIVAVISYSLHDCAQACASYNRDSGKLACKAATFNSDLTSIGTNYGTCFLKNNTGGAVTGTSNIYAGLTLAGSN
ncbi:hypothetical protein G7Y89_g5538 [Cudoniella acicularis]|uniref:Apple domain-containing protein n=1 Tax=Cudoniella acicularis TaxID=354080 RepID=A0A8H4RMA8_9HELO|nr:hypothetical protein G7Y89_g5538 [Cudoniella acicularis]